MEYHKPNTESMPELLVGITQEKKTELLTILASERLEDIQGMTNGLHLVSAFDLYRTLYHGQQYTFSPVVLGELFRLIFRDLKTIISTKTVDMYRQADLIQTIDGLFELATSNKAFADELKSIISSIYNELKGAKKKKSQKLQRESSESKRKFVAFMKHFLTNKSLQDIYSPYDYQKLGLQDIRTGYQARYFT